MADFRPLAKAVRLWNRPTPLPPNATSHRFELWPAGAFGYGDGLGNCSQAVRHWITRHGSAPPFPRLLRRALRAAGLLATALLVPPAGTAFALLRWTELQPKAFGWLARPIAASVVKDPRRYLIGFLAPALLAAGALLYREHATVTGLRAQLRTAQESQTRSQAQAMASDAQSRQHALELEQRLHELEQLAQAEHNRARDAAAHLHDLETRADELQSRLAAAERTIAKLKAPPPAKANPAATAAAIAAAQVDHARQRMEQRYGPLAKQLGLTPDQTDQFMKLLVDKRMATSDVTAAAAQQGGAALQDRAAFTSLVTSQQDDIENQIQALLGDAGYAQYLAATVTTGQSNSIVRLQAALSGTAPLNDAQVAQLQQLLSQDNIGHITSDIVAEAQAQGFLSPTQLQALQTLYQQQQAAQQRRHSPPAAPAPKP